jgi:RimJ/RimL family protein N-acetyltransferase
MSEPSIVSLGPLTEAAIEPMREAIRTIGGKVVSVDDVRRRVAASGEWADHGVEFGVSRGNELLGVVQAVMCPFRDPRDVYEVGILIIDPRQRGQGLGFQALNLLLAHLFDERRALRVWFTTDVDNVAMRRLGEHLGFRLEGTLRGGRVVEGRLIDEVLYGMTRDDPRASNGPGPALVD